MPHLLVSAANKSSGKTTVAVGLCAAFSRRGRSVQPFKKGPDYIDPMWLSLAAGRPCRNLDFNTQTADEIRGLFARHAAAADLAVVEGNKGLFDGTDLEGGNSTAALAGLLRSPVILVIDAHGITRGVAPLVLGYRAFEPKIALAGVVLNKVAGARHESKLRAAIERYTDVPVLGAIHRADELEIAERHLGLVPTGELGAAEAKVQRIARIVAGGVDLDAIEALAAAAPPPMAPVEAVRPPHPKDLRIAVARDPAFAFYYADDLESLQRCGAELVPLDMRHDPRLPDVDGLFIGGGFPETQAEALAANRSLRRDIRQAIDAGLPCYAECGGLMYLARSIHWQGRRYEMVGAIAADAVMHDRPVGRGHVRLRETGRGPWPLRTADGQPAEFAAHEFHYSALENLGPDTAFAYDVRRGHGVDGRHDGIVKANLLASYAHLRTVGANAWTERFVAFVRQLRDRRRFAVPTGRISAA